MLKILQEKVPAHQWQETNPSAVKSAEPQVMKSIATVPIYGNLSMKDIWKEITTRDFMLVF